MFKSGDIVKTTYESGGGLFRVQQILNETHMLVKSLDEDFDFTFAVKFNEWVLDPTHCRKSKLTKILGKLRNK